MHHTYNTYIMTDLFNYKRRESTVAQAGSVAIGGDNPIRVQSMTTTNTNDTEACVAQAERIIKAGSPHKACVRRKT